MKEILKNKKIIIPLCIVLMVIVIAAACLAFFSESKAKRQSTPEVISAMEKTEEALSTVKSVHSILNTDVEMNAGKDEIAMHTEIGIYQDSKKEAIKAESLMSIDGYGSQAFTSYVDLKNKTLYTSLDSGISWIKGIISEEEIEAYKSKADLSFFISDIGNYVEKGTETIGDTELIRYEGVINSDQIETIISNAEFDKVFDSEELADEDLKNICEKSDGAEICLWIEKETSLPYKISIDMTEIMKSLISLNNKESAQNVKSAVITYEQRQYNNVDPIQIPEEALKIK